MLQGLTCWAKGMDYCLFCWLESIISVNLYFSSIEHMISTNISIFVPWCSHSHATDILYQWIMGRYHVWSSILSSERHLRFHCFGCRSYAHMYKCRASIFFCRVCLTLYEIVFHQVFLMRILSNANPTGLERSHTPISVFVCGSWSFLSPTTLPCFVSDCAGPGLQISRTTISSTVMFMLCWQFSQVSSINANGTFPSSTTNYFDRSSSELFSRITHTGHHRHLTLCWLLVRVANASSKHLRNLRIWLHRLSKDEENFLVLSVCHPHQRGAPVWQFSFVQFALLDIRHLGDLFSLLVPHR